MDWRGHSPAASDKQTDFEGTVSAYPTPNVLPTFRECGNPAVMFSNNLEHTYTVAGSYYS